MSTTVALIWSLIPIGAVFWVFAFWALRIARSMSNGGTRQSAIVRLTSISDCLKFPLVTIPFAYWAFHVACELEKTRYTEQVSDRSKGVYGLVGGLAACGAAAWLTAYVAL